MCSTTRGPAIWPSLVTWPTRTPPFPSSSRSGSGRGRCRAPASPCRGPISTVSVHMVWIEVDDGERGRPPLRQGGDDVLDVGLGGKFDLRRRARGARRAGAPAPPPLRPRCRRRARPAGPSRRRPASERRLADAGIAADQDRRAAAQSRRRRPGRARRCRRPSAAPRGPRPRGPRGKDAPLARTPRRHGPGEGAAGAGLLDEVFQPLQASQRPFQRL